MLIKLNWYDYFANKQIGKAYWYWTTWANEKHIKSKKKGK